MQLHLQVAPEVVPGLLERRAVPGGRAAGGRRELAVPARSRLWAETRIPLFEQSCDVRTPELRNQGVRPRVWFGERWITSILDLFAENSRYFPGLLPLTEDIDPLARAGRGPGAGAGRAAAAQRHDLALEPAGVRRRAAGCRTCASRTGCCRPGPTAVDMVANALFFYGLLRVLVEAERPLWSSMSFEAAQENFTSAARHGLDGPLYWPGTGWIRPDELVLRKLLPQAAEGLARWGVAAEVIDRYLTVIERRCLTGARARRGSSTRSRRWRTRGADRAAALHGMFAPLPGALGGERAGAHLAAAPPEAAEPAVRSCKRVLPFGPAGG